jgi:thiamine biosynthesis lipoprotein
MPDQPLTVAREAMATRFEIALFGENPVALRGAAEEALDEVQRIDTLLGWRNPASPIAQLNARAATEPVRVNPELFAFLNRCRDFHTLSNGAFDVTIGPLMHAWGFHGGDDSRDPGAIAAARAACGWSQLELDSGRQTVRFLQPGMRLDFGAVGKGYALDLAGEILHDAGITAALLHGGTSTVKAIGHPPGETGWKIAVEYPPGDDPNPPLPILTILELSDESMSVSAVWGRVFRVGKDSFGHVIDPRTGCPADRALLSIWVTDEAITSDALSTALLTDGVGGLEHYRQACPNARMLVLAGNHEHGYEIGAHGIEWSPRPESSSRVANDHGRT